jgi:glutamine amidotransferase
MITIIDYGMGNLGSISNMLKRIGAQSMFTSASEEISGAEKIILPGVGHFDRAMENLDKLGLIETIKNKVLNDKTPILGICLGMQLMCMSSEEGTRQGLGLIDAVVKRFRFSHNNLKIPHMGWNIASPKKDSNLFINNQIDTRFYFVHSYYVVCNETNDTLTTTNHGFEFISSFEHNNIIGVQFHPEKSHRFGMELLKNFVEKY